MLAELLVCLLAAPSARANVWTVDCSVLATQRLDPVVFPGADPAGHVHSGKIASVAIFASESKCDCGSSFVQYLTVCQQSMLCRRSDRGQQVLSWCELPGPAGQPLHLLQRRRRPLQLLGAPALCPQGEGRQVLLRGQRFSCLLQGSGRYYASKKYLQTFVTDSLYPSTMAPDIWLSSVDHGARPGGLEQQPVAAGRHLSLPAGLPSAGGGPGQHSACRQHSTQGGGQIIDIFIYLFVIIPVHGSEHEHERVPSGAGGLLGGAGGDHLSLLLGWQAGLPRPRLPPRLPNRRVAGRALPRLSPHQAPNSLLRGKSQSGRRRDCKFSSFVVGNLPNGVGVRGRGLAGVQLQRLGGAGTAR